MRVFVFLGSNVKPVIVGNVLLDKAARKAIMTSKRVLKVREVLKNFMVPCKECEEHNLVEAPVLQTNRRKTRP